MKRIAIFVSALVLLVIPLAATAHQHATYTIGGVEYQFVVGSLNEPVAVDDKTGVDFRVTMVGHEAMEANDHHAEGGAVTGLENTLKVELIAGKEKKTLDLSPVYNTPGAYKAAFYPTVATTLSYRFFGTINDTPVDLTFTCRAEGAAKAEDSTEAKEISPGVIQTSLGGGFGCPAAKEGMGFPEAAPSLLSLDASSDQGMWGIGLGAFALLLAGFSLMKPKA